MNEKLNVKRVVVQGGGKLNGAFLRAGLIDEVHVVVLPALVGGERTPTLFDAPELESGQGPVRLKLLSAQVQADGKVWLR
jgi:riboflavin biosynthesis pyrimidine reductase